MKVLPRTQFGNPILRSKSKRVSLKSIKSKKFQELLKAMIYTMRRTNGVGLAAPQIGKSVQLAVMEIRPTSTRPNIKKKGPAVVINPKIIKHSRERIVRWEGCLSLKGVRGNPLRSKSVTVEYYNESGDKVVERATGLWANIFQHEIDHLNGTLYVDRMEDMKKLMTLQEFKKRILKK